MHPSRDADAAGLRNAIQPRCHVDPVTKDVVFLNDHVPLVDAHSEFNTLVVRDMSVSLSDGSIVKTTGDGLLVEFPSVLGAVQCAVDVQRMTVVLGDLGVGSALSGGS